MRIKKELLEVALIFVLGIIFLILLAINVNYYDNIHPTQVNQVETF